MCNGRVMPGKYCFTEDIYFVWLSQSFYLLLHDLLKPMERVDDTHVPLRVAHKVSFLHFFMLNNCVSILIIIY